MSHFSLLVCIDDPSKLDEALAPFDEGKEVEPYRSYEDGEASEYWLYDALKRADKDDREGTGIRPYEPNQLGWSSASSKDTPAVQRQKIAADAALFRSLPDPITWADIVKLSNERYSDDGDPLILAEDGRAYTMSTYNPESKWDYWRIGGRWGGYFRYREDCRAQVIQPKRAWDSPKAIEPGTCDGGPKSALDLGALREVKADEARRTYAEFHKLVEGTPEARPWSEFVELRDKVDGYTIDQARTEYHSQPRVQALRETDFRWHDDAIATFQKPERLFIEIERARAVPGYALLTTDGKWMAPGRMGWFGCGTDTESDRAGYWEVANAYIDALPDSTWLIAVDCHI